MMRSSLPYIFQHTIASCNSSYRSPAQYKVNSLGPIHGITAFLPLLRASNTKKIIVIGSGAADPTRILTLNMVNMVGYGMTKAAALIATTKFALKLKDEGFVVITLSPGVVDCSATAGADSASCLTLTCSCPELRVDRRSTGRKH